MKVKGKLMAPDEVFMVISAVLSSGTGKGMLQEPTALTMLGPTAGKTMPEVVNDPPMLTLLALRYMIPPVNCDTALYPGTVIPHLDGKKPVERVKDAAVMLAKRSQ